jgi:hypothetical protein
MAHQDRDHQPVAALLDRMGLDLLRPTGPATPATAEGESAAEAGPPEAGRKPLAGGDGRLDLRRCGAALSAARDRMGMLADGQWLCARRR